MSEGMPDLGALLASVSGQLRVAAFVDAVREHGAVAGHPDTLAALESHPEYATLFPGVRLVPVVYFTSGTLYAGKMIRDVADAREKNAARSGPRS